MNFDPKDRFAPVPRRFYDAFARGELNARQFLLGCYLAGATDFESGEVSLTLRALFDGCDWPWSDDTLSRDLRALRPDWISFEVGQGQRQPYVIRLTGLRRRELQPRRNLRGGDSSAAEVAAPLRKSGQDANPRAECDSTGTQSLHGGSPKEEKRREEIEPVSEEKLDHVLGKPTAATPDPFLAKFNDLERKRRGDDGPARPLTDEQKTELGTLPIAEVHRRYERGELT